MSDVEMKDTSKIQLASVKNFLSELGYSWFNIDRGFYSSFETNKGRSWISLNTAVKVHNGFYNERHGRGFEPEGLFGNIPYEWWQAAQRAKIVHTVYLQNSKKLGRIVCQKHWVRFVEPENAQLLLK